MEPTTLVLETVTVRPYDAYTLVENMMRKISDNYSESPNAMMAFYRETVKQHKRYVSISEAVVDIYKASYVNDLKEDETRLYKARKSSDVKKQDTIVFKLQGGPDGILLMDVIKNPYVLFSDGKIANYLFEIDEVISIDGKINYSVSFKQKTFVEQPLYFGKLFIDVNTNALTAAEFSLNIADKNKAAALFIRKKPLGMKITPENTTYIVKYKEKDGKYYFNYARNEVTFKVDWNKRFFNSYYTIMSEIAVTDRNENNVSEFTRKERLNSNIVFSEKLTAFADDDFWGEYNTIEPEESIEAAIKKYGKRLMKD
jgi:YHS domain-containing protein